MSEGERGAAVAKAEEEEEHLEARRKEAEVCALGQPCVGGVCAHAAEAADYGWMRDVDPDSYEDFTIKRVARVVKPRGVAFFKARSSSENTCAYAPFVTVCTWSRTSILKRPKSSGLVVLRWCRTLQVCVRGGTPRASRSVAGEENRICDC
eukprot:1966361-Amphidinium_carterae.1